MKHSVRQITIESMFIHLGIICILFTGSAVGQYQQDEDIYPSATEFLYDATDSSSEDNTMRQITYTSTGANYPTGSATSDTDMRTTVPSDVFWTTVYPRHTGALSQNFSANAGRLDNTEFSANNFTFRNYATQRPWHSVYPSTFSTPRQWQVQTQRSNNDSFINGSVWKFQNRNETMSPKPLCQKQLKHAKKIDKAWRKCEQATGLTNVTNVSKIPCFSKCLMGKLKLITKKSTVNEKETVQMFKLDTKAKEVQEEQVRIWRNCVHQIDEVTKGSYGGIDSSCDNHAAFMTCGLQEMARSCVLQIDSRNITFTDDKSISTG